MSFFICDSLEGTAKLFRGYLGIFRSQAHCGKGDAEELHFFLLRVLSLFASFVFALIALIALHYSSLCPVAELWAARPRFRINGHWNLVCGCVPRANTADPAGPQPVWSWIMSTTAGSGSFHIPDASTFSMKGKEEAGNVVVPFPFRSFM